MSYPVQEIFEAFETYGDFVSARPYGNGHINDTFAVVSEQAGRTVRYILQRINHHVFKKPVELMDNIHRICSETHRRLEEAGVPDASRRSLTTILNREGLPYHRDSDGNFWRLYLFIEDAVGYDIVENREQAYEAAFAFGKYQELLTELPGKRLFETIPGFHDTPGRFRRFNEVLGTDSKGRRGNVGKEIDFFLSYENQVASLTDKAAAGILPERVTHNDTKLNNVLIDQESHKAVCVIDLDTSMPGLAAYDFGDLVRTSTSPVAEDEQDSSKVKLLPEMFQALAEGYLNAARFLTPAEVDSLIMGAKLMTYEVGIRFLTDYLEGDLYFKTAYPEHNLVRCRTQIKLIQSMEEQMQLLEDIIGTCRKEAVQQ